MLSFDRSFRPKHITILRQHIWMDVIIITPEKLYTFRNWADMRKLIKLKQLGIFKKGNTIF